MATLAREPNVAVKISGLGVPGQPWTAEVEPRGGPADHRALQWTARCSPRTSRSTASSRPSTRSTRGSRTIVRDFARSRTGGGSSTTTPSRFYRPRRPPRLTAVARARQGRRARSDRRSGQPRRSGRAGESGRRGRSPRRSRARCVTPNGDASRRTRSPPARARPDACRARPRSGQIGYPGRPSRGPSPRAHPHVAHEVRRGCVDRAGAAVVPEPLRRSGGMVSTRTWPTSVRGHDQEAREGEHAEAPRAHAAAQPPPALERQPDQRHARTNSGRCRRLFHGLPLEAMRSAQRARRGQSGPEAGRRRDAPRRRQTITPATRAATELERVADGSPRASGTAPTWNAGNGSPEWSGGRSDRAHHAMTPTTARSSHPFTRADGTVR